MAPGPPPLRKDFAPPMSITSNLLSLSSRLIPNRPVEELEKQLSNLRSSVDSRVGDFYRDLRQGRAELIAGILDHTAGVAAQHWVEFEAATGDALTHLGRRVELLGQLDLVDSSDEELAPSRQRIAAEDLGNVRAVVGEATSWRPAEPVDVVLLPYALSNTADWFTAVDNARDMLRPGGLVGVVDFFAARGGGDEAGGRLAGLMPRLLGEDVHASADFAGYLSREFELVSMDRHAADIPYVPIGVPYFRFIGRKR